MLAHRVVQFGFQFWLSWLLEFVWVAGAARFLCPADKSRVIDELERVLRLGVKEALEVSIRSLDLFLLALVAPEGVLRILIYLRPTLGAVPDVVAGFRRRTTLVHLSVPLNRYQIASE